MNFTTGSITQDQWKRGAEVLEVDINDVFSGLKLPAGKSGNWELRHQRIKKGHSFKVSEISDTILIGRQAFSVVAPKAMSLNVLVQHKKSKETTKSFPQVWMSDVPAEVYSHVQGLKNMSGRVLVGGLGIGLAVSMLERNPNVTSITVVEKSKDVVKLVWPHLNTTKTKLVTQDLFIWLGHQILYSTHSERPLFDHAFLDIWIPSGEYVFNKVVFPLRGLVSAIVPPKNIICWKEDTMLGQIRLSIDISISMHEATAKWGDKVPEGMGQINAGNLFKIEESEFLKAKEMLGRKWAFYNWCRKREVDPEGMREALPLFMDALTDYPKWEGRWKRYWDEEHPY